MRSFWALAAVLPMVLTGCFALPEPLPKSMFDQAAGAAAGDVAEGLDADVDSWDGADAAVDADVQDTGVDAADGSADVLGDATDGGVDAVDAGHDAVADAEDATPDVEDTTPDIEDATPDIEDASPDIEDTTPDIEDTTPDIEDIGPDTEDTGPDIEDAGTTPVIPCEGGPPLLLETWSDDHGWTLTGSPFGPLGFGGTLSITAAQGDPIFLELPVPVWPDAMELEVVFSFVGLGDGGSLGMFLASGPLEPGGDTGALPGVLVTADGPSAPKLTLSGAEGDPLPISVGATYSLGFEVGAEGVKVTLRTGDLVLGTLESATGLAGSGGVLAFALHGPAEVMLSTVRVCGAGQPAVCSACGTGKPCLRKYCNPLEGCGEAVVESACDDGIACTLDVCDPSSGTCDSIPDHAACDDANLCNGPEACSLVVGCVPGVPLACKPPTADPCDVEETCSPALGCVEVPPVEGCCATDAECDDDDDRCNGWGLCAAGTCISFPASDCQDTDPCDGLTACNPDTGLCTTAPPVPCDDGDPCNGLEECLSPLGCVASVPPVCTDGDPCNGQESCEPFGGCTSGPPPECDDGDACNGYESCAPLVGCVGGPPLECDDGNVCNGGESCDVAAGCIPGPPLECDDGDACDGLELCDPVAGCESVGPLECDDGDACNGEEPCDPVAGCLPGDPPQCDDGEPCNGAESCEAPAGCVSGAPPDCDDGDACNGPEACAPGLGCDPPAPVDCDDGSACTLDACDPATGCLSTEGACDDGDPCNGAESCAPDGVSCEAGEPVSCDDGVPCTLDTCGQGGQCESALADGSCLIDGVCLGLGDADPLDPCMVCDPATDPVGWSPKSCSDEGTVRACESETGACTFVSCNAGWFDADEIIENGCECQQTSLYETCDGVDNDCDGAVDDGIDLETDTDNCGACGHVCDVGPGATPACRFGHCFVAACADFTYDQDGDAANGCEVGGAGQQLQVSAGGSIMDTLAIAEPGDIVTIEPGTYAEDVVVDVPGVTLRGGTDGEVVIVAAGGDHGIAVGADEVVLEGLVVTGEAATGVRLDGVTGGTLRRVTVRELSAPVDQAISGGPPVAALGLTDCTGVELTLVDVDQLTGRDAPDGSNGGSAEGLRVVLAKGLLLQGARFTDIRGGGMGPGAHWSAGDARGIRAAAVSSSTVRWSRFVGVHGGGELDEAPEQDAMMGRGGRAIGAELFGASAGNLFDGNEWSGLTGGTGGGQSGPGVAYGVVLQPDSTSNTLSMSNLVEGEPLLYCSGQAGVVFEGHTLSSPVMGTNLGRIAAVGCPDIVIRDNVVTWAHGSAGGWGAAGEDATGIRVAGAGPGSRVEDNQVMGIVGGRGGPGSAAAPTLVGAAGVARGILIEASDGVVVTGNEVADVTGGEGAYTDHESGSTGGAAVGVELESCSGVTLTANGVHDVTGGVAAGGTPSAVPTVGGAGYGARILASTDTTIDGLLVGHVSSGAHPAGAGATGEALGVLLDGGVGASLSHVGVSDVLGGAVEPPAVPAPRAAGISIRGCPAVGMSFVTVLGVGEAAESSAIAVKGDVGGPLAATLLLLSDVGGPCVDNLSSSAFGVDSSCLDCATTGPLVTFTKSKSAPPVFLSADTLVQAAGSPCLDLGPQIHATQCCGPTPPAVCMEPQANACRANPGVHGGTPLATPSAGAASDCRCQELP